MRTILLLASLFGFSQTTAGDVTTAAASRTTISWRPVTTSSQRNQSSAQTAWLNTSPITSRIPTSTPVKATSTYPLTETASTWLSTNSTTAASWTRDMAIIVAVPCAIGVVILVIVIIVVVCLVVRSRNKREINRLSRRPPVLPNGYEAQNLPEDNQFNRHKVNNKPITEVVNRQPGHPFTYPSDDAVDVRSNAPSHDSIYANQIDLVDEAERPDSCYLNSNEIAEISKQNAQQRNKDKQISNGRSDQRNVNQTKAESSRRIPDNEDEDLYLRHTGYNGRNGMGVSTPHSAGMSEEHLGDESGEDEYTNHIEMVRQGATGARRDSADSGNYLNSADLEMLRNTRIQNNAVSSIYAPTVYAVPRK